MPENKIHCDVPIVIKTQFNCDCSEIIFFLPGSILSEIKFKSYFISQLIINI